MLEDLDAVLDVGGVYDPARDRYDHHQKGFEEVFGHGFSTKLSSAGLVYKVKFSSKLPILVMGFTTSCLCHLYGREFLYFGTIAKCLWIILF